MKKKLSLGVIILILVLMPATLFAQGSGLPGTGWLTGEQIQNVGSNTATIGIVVYDVETGGAIHTGDSDLSTPGNQDASVEPGASVNYLPDNFATMPDGFVGSAVVNSSEPIVGIVNETNGSAAGQYQGASSSQTSTTLNFPLAKSAFNGKETSFYIQNAGTTATTMQATFRPSGGGAPVVINSPSIEANRMWVLLLDGQVDNGQLGSLTVTASQPLAGVVNEFQVDGSGASSGNATVLQATRGFGSNEADNSVFSPIFKQRFNNRSTGHQIQNTGASAADVTMSVTCSLPAAVAGQTFEFTAEDVPAGASVTFFNGGIINPAGNSSYTMPDCLGSATFTSANPVVGIVNEGTDNSDLPPGTRFTTYSMFGEGQTSGEIAVPLYKESHNSRVSGLQVQNTTNAEVLATITFKLAANATTPPTTYTLTGVGIPAGGSITCFKLGDPGQDTCLGASQPGSWTGGNQTVNGTFGAATVEANGNVVAIIAEADESGGQDIKNYEGFNQ